MKNKSWEKEFVGGRKMKNLKAIQKHWKDKFRKEFGCYYDEYWEDCWSKRPTPEEVENFLSIAIAGTVKEILTLLDNQEKKYKKMVKEILELPKYNPKAVFSVDKGKDVNWVFQEEDIINLAKKYKLI